MVSFYSCRLRWFLSGYAGGFVRALRSSIWCVYTSMVVYYIHKDDITGGCDDIAYKANVKINWTYTRGRGHQGGYKQEIYRWS